MNVELLEKFLVDEEAQGNLDVVGLVSEIAGVDGFVDLEENNMKRADRALVITMITKDGKKYKAYGSKAVSEAFRSKKYSLGDLHGLRVIQSETQDDKVPVLKVVGWQGKTIRTKVASVATAKPTAEVIMANITDFASWD